MKHALILMVFLLANELPAETRRSIPQPKFQSAASPRSNEYLRKVSLGVGAGMMQFDGNSYLGGQLGFLVRLDDRSPIYLGAESGLYGIGQDNGSEYLIPLAATFLTRFDIHNSAFHPILGLSLGALFQHSSDSTTENVTNTYFYGEIRPGFEIDFSKSISLSLEPRVGYLKGNVIFHPVIGLSIGL